MPPNTPYLTITEIAQTVLDVTGSCVRRWIMLGKLKATKTGQMWLINRDDLDQAILDGEINLDETRGRPRKHR